MSGINIIQNHLQVFWFWLPFGLQAIAVFLILLFNLYLAGQQKLCILDIFLFAILSTFGAFIGGKVWVTFCNTGRLVFSPQFWTGPFGTIGILIGAGIFGGLYLKERDFSVAKHADKASPAIACGYAIARIGCFLNGCCYGTPTNLPWAIRFSKGTSAFHKQLSEGLIDYDASYSLGVHPTQLYHAFLGLFLFYTLSKWQPKWPGSRVALGLLLYGIFRFFIQFLRGDRIPLVSWLDLNQIFSFIFVVIAGLLWWRFGKKTLKSKKKTYPTLG